jgi:glycosyltransferase involved in cell wall biosynthesis
MGYHDYERILMRAVHIIPAVTKESSGPSYSVVNLCKSLIKCTADVQLVALDWETIESPPKFLKTFSMGWMPRRLGQSPKLFRWLSNQVKSQKIDILHSHGMWQMNALYPGWVAKNSESSLIVSPRGTFSKWAMQNGSSMKVVFWAFFQRPALMQVDCFHATSESEYKDIRRLGFNQPVAVIPNGIDIPDLPKKNKNRFRTVLFLGRIHPVKGLDILLPAWKEVQSHFPEWQLIIAGSDDDYYGKSGYLKKMHDLSNKLNLNRISFVGELNGHAKLQAYCDADLFILPSYSENFGVTIAEALSTGTPVITTKGTPWEEIQNQKAGWWIDVNTESLTASMKEALQLSSFDLEKIGKNGRRWMENDFSWQHTGEDMFRTYQWLCDKSQPVPGWVKMI